MFYKFSCGCIATRPNTFGPGSHGQPLPVIRVHCCHTDFLNCSEWGIEVVRSENLLADLEEKKSTPLTVPELVEVWDALAALVARGSAANDLMAALKRLAE